MSPMLASTTTTEQDITCYITQRYLSIESRINSPSSVRMKI